MKLATLSLFCAALELTAQPKRVQNVHVTILSTMLADDVGFGEWGFAALVDADGHRILFDTGAHPDTVLRNLKALKLDISGIEEVILSHHHGDHTAGLIRLRQEFSKTNPRALSRAHVGQGIFTPRNAGNPMIGVKAEYESLGGSFVVHDRPVELHPGIWLRGPVPRKYPERNWSGSRQLQLPDGRTEEDNLPEDQS